MKNKRKDTKNSDCVWHCYEGLTTKYEKAMSVFVTVSKENASQSGLGSHRPHGTRPGLRNILSQTCDKFVCTFQIKFIFLLLYLLSFYPLSFRLSYVLLLSVGPLFPTYYFSYCATNRKVAGRSQIMSLEFFVDIILPFALWPCGRLNL